MSILSDEQILSELDSGALILYPLLERGQVKGAKVDLRLDNVFSLIKRIDVASYDAMELRSASSRPIDYLERHVVSYKNAFILHPGEFALAPTFESVRIPNNTIGLLDGRSSLGRLGIIVHVTSGSVDPGFSGPLVLELANLGRIPVKLYPLMRIASMKFVEIKGNVKHAYKEKYVGMKNLLHPLSRLHEDEDLRLISRIHEFL